MGLSLSSNDSKCCCLNNNASENSDIGIGIDNLKYKNSEKSNITKTKSNINIDVSIDSKKNLITSNNNKDNVSSSIKNKSLILRTVTATFKNLENSNNCSVNISKNNIIDNNNNINPNFTKNKSEVNNKLNYLDLKGIKDSKGNLKLSNIQDISEIASNNLTHSNIPSSTSIIINNTSNNNRININLGNSFNNKSNTKKNESLLLSSINNNLKNYTFSSETNNLIKGSDNYLRFLFKNNEKNNNNNSFKYIPKLMSNKADDAIFQMDCIVNNYSINNKLIKTKTKNLNQNIKYVLLTSHSIKIYKSKDYYISYGKTITDILLSHITNIELVKNPFSKIMLHSINLTYGEDNCKLSLSSIEGKDIELWYKLIKFFVNY